MVAAADKVRNPGQPFRLTNTLVDYVRVASPRSRGPGRLCPRRHGNTPVSNLVRYSDPPRDAGKLVLMDGPAMWFYDPASKASIRISPQQRLIGQASNGDVMTVNLARDYTAKLAGAETLKDADRRDRRLLAPRYAGRHSATPSTAASNTGSSRAITGRSRASSIRTAAAC